MSRVPVDNDQQGSGSLCSVVLTWPTDVQSLFSIFSLSCDKYSGKFEKISDSQMCIRLLV